MYIYTYVFQELLANRSVCLYVRTNAWTQAKAEAILR